MGADGVNDIECQILVGDAGRQWFEAKYFRPKLRAIGQIKSFVPAAPNEPDNLLDALIVFLPNHFGGCPSMATVKRELAKASFLDFHAEPEKIPKAWPQLREEARSIFSGLCIWQADLLRMK